MAFNVITIGCGLSGALGKWSVPLVLHINHMLMSN